MARTGEAADSAMGLSLLLEDLDLDLDPNFLINPHLFSTLPHVVDVLERQNNNNNNNSAVGAAHELDANAISSSAAVAVLERNLQLVTSLLEGKVNKHYRAFGSSVSSFSHIFQDFTEVQHRVSRLKTHVASTKHALRTRKYGLRDLREQRGHYAQVLELLDHARQVAEAPSRFRSLLMSGLVVQCVDEWKAAHHLAFSDGLRDLPALEEVRHDLMGHKQAIYETLLRYLNRALARSCVALEPLATRVVESDQDVTIGSSTQRPDIPSLVEALLGLDRLTSAVQSIRRGLRTDVQRLFAYHLRKAMARSPLRSQSYTGDDSSGSGSGAMTLYRRGLAVRQVLEPILTDALELLRNHAALVVLPGVRATGYTVDEVWSALQVQAIEFLDLHVQPPTSSSQSASAARAATQASDRGRGGLGRRRSSGATVIGDSGTRQLCFLELSLDDLDPRSSSVALGNDLQSAHGGGAVAGAGGPGPDSNVHHHANGTASMRKWQQSGVGAGVGAGAGTGMGASDTNAELINNNDDQDDDDEEDDEVVLSVPLCVPHAQVLVALCEPVAGFVEDALTVVQQVGPSTTTTTSSRRDRNSNNKNQKSATSPSGSCRLLEHLREAGVDLMKPMILAAMQERLDAVLTSSGICELHSDYSSSSTRLKPHMTLADSLLLTNSTGDFASVGTWTNSALLDLERMTTTRRWHDAGDNDDGTGDLYDSYVRSIAAAETLAVVRDLRAMSLTVPDHVCRLEDLIPLALRQFVNIHRQEHDNVLAGSRVLALVSNGRWGLARLAIDSDPVLQRLCGLVPPPPLKSDLKSGTNQNQIEHMSETRWHSFAARQSVLVQEFVGGKDCARLTGPLSRSAQVTLAATAASVSWVASHLGVGGTHVKDSSVGGVIARDSPAMQAVAHDLRTLRRDCLVALHVNALLLVHDELDADVVSPTQINGGSAPDERLASRLTRLSTHLAAMCSAVSTVSGPDKRQTSYMLHSVHFAIVHAVVTYATKLAENPVVPSVSAFKALLRNTLVLEAVLSEHSNGWLCQSQRRAFAVTQRYLAALFAEPTASQSGAEMQALVVELGEVVPGLDVGSLKVAAKRRSSSASVAAMRGMSYNGVNDGNKTGG